MSTVLSIVWSVDDPVPAKPGDPADPANPADPQIPADPPVPAETADPADPGAVQRPEKQGNPEKPLAPGAPAAPSAPESTTGIVLADAGGVGLPVVGLLLLLALGLGIVVGLLIRRAQRVPADRTASPADTAPGAAPGDPTPSPAAAERERARAEQLAAGLVDARDRVDNPALVAKIGATLEHAGWFTIDPTGTTFDPNTQKAVDREPTDDPAQHRVVFATERLGYRDAAGQLLRAPEVVVRDYRPPTGRSGA